jgi:hypothetical protein
MGCDAVRGQVRQKCIMRECVCVCAWVCGRGRVCAVACRRVSDDELGLFWASGPFFGWEQGRYAHVCVCVSVCCHFWYSNGSRTRATKAAATWGKEQTNERLGPWLGPGLGLAWAWLGPGLGLPYRLTD